MIQERINELVYSRNPRLFLLPPHRLLQGRDNPRSERRIKLNIALALKSAYPQTNTSNQLEDETAGRGRVSRYGPRTAHGESGRRCVGGGDGGAVA